MDSIDVTQAWHECLVRWPDDMPRRGVLVTNFGEQIVFNNFLLTERMILVERHAPDTMGARQVMLPLAHVLGLKITDVVRAKCFTELGFIGKTPSR